MRDYQVKEVHGYDKIHNGLLGIEVEVEGINLPRIDEKNIWKAIKDGSLRGEAMEYVLRVPLNPDKAINAITHLNELLKESVLLMSFRTSVHVHINIQHLYKSQLNRFIYTSFLLENLLVEFSGEERVGNRFCLRLKDALYQAKYIEAVLKNPDILPRISIEDGKYAAINLSVMRNYGSIEFRSMHGTLDCNTLATWVKLLTNIFEFAKTSTKSCEELSEWVDEAPEDFLNAVMGKEAPLLKFKGFEEGMRESEALLFPCAAQEFKLDPLEAVKKVVPKELAGWDAVAFEDLLVPAVGIPQDFDVNIPVVQQIRRNPVINRAFLERDREDDAE